MTSLLSGCFRGEFWASLFLELWVTSEAPCLTVYVSASAPVLWAPCTRV